MSQLQVQGTVNAVQPRAPSTDVDVKHPQYMHRVDDWDAVAVCVAGRHALLAGGTRWLPHPSDAPAVTDADGSRYKNYQARAAFVNATGRTLQGLLGIVFAEAVSIELTGQLSVLEKDVDGRNISLLQMARGMLSQNLQRGRGGILVDWDGSFMDTQAKLGRALLRFFTAKQIINWRVVGNKTKLVVIRWEEFDDLEDDFNQYKVIYWLELRIKKDGKAYSRLWRDSSASATAGGSGGAAITDLLPIMIGGKHADALPFRWLGAMDNDAEPDVPPLADLAHMNIMHFQAEADIAEISHLVGNPTLVVSGITTQWAKTMFPNGVFLGSTEGLQLPVNADAKIIQAEDRNMPLVLAERRESQMAKLGAKLVERGGGVRTATQAQDEAQTDNSILSLCAANVEDCINQALELAAGYTGGKGTGKITLPKKYDIALLDSQAITALLAGVQQGTILLEDFVRYTQKIGVADPTETPEMIMDKLRNQAPIGIGYDDPNSENLNNGTNSKPAPAKQQPSAKDKTAKVQ